MAVINLREFYPWYKQDEFVEVPDVVAGELFAERRYQQNHERGLRRNKVLSLDAGDGTDEAASLQSTDNPEEIFLRMNRFCSLCNALNSLSEKQGKRIEAHYIFGKSQRAIAESENVGESTVSESIKLGLEEMKKYLKKFE